MLPNLETLPIKGVYSLIIFLNKEILLKVQKLGCFTLQRGYYTYTGSAVGDGAVSLKKRVARHLRKKKLKRWHIDFLLADKNAAVVGVMAAESIINKECQINNMIKNFDGATVPIVGFGASDCRRNCQSHLLYFGKVNVKEKIVETYTRLFGTSATSSFLEVF